MAKDEIKPVKGSANKEPATAKDVPESAAKVGKPAPAAAVAKAGKRSAKAQAETEAKAAKEERKAQPVEVKAKKPSAKPPRSRAERAGKKYREAAEKIDRSKAYSLAEAVEQAAAASPTKFDAAVELHINLNVDPKQADQNIRGTVVLPAGTGKILRVAALTENTAKAKAAGAEPIDADELLKQLDSEVINFDILVAEPEMMPKLAKYARLLGPKGLMPNPKSGTVSTDIAKAVTSAKSGQVEYRVDSYGIIHLAIGRVGFGPAKLTQNAESVLAELKQAKPAGLKGSLIRSAYVTSSMGPSVKVDV